jgi:membrane-bound lytic murein transglycosylase B
MADARRAPFWKRELIAALRLLQDGAVAPERFVGSWAGAAGHTQFIPSTFAAHAVDFDRDGRRDLWGSVADALASAANYLRTSGWVAGVPWGFEVALPPRFDYTWSAPGRARPYAAWLAAGVRPARSTEAATDRVQPLQLLLPAGARGPAFLVTQNFRALLRYNQSTSYALAAGHLADRIGGGPPLVTPWPADDKPLSRAEREELQSLLSAWGHDTGGHDGIIGERTRAAIRTTQRTLNLIEDGYPSLELLDRLRRHAGP